MSDKSVDAQILKLRRKHRQISCGYNLETDNIFVRDRLIHFHTQVIAQTFEIMVPDYFEPLSEPDINKRFVSEQPPQAVLANMSRDESLSFSFFTSESGLSEEAAQLKSALSTLYPTNTFYEQGVVQSESGPVSWFDYKSPSLRGERYNLLFLFALSSEQRALGSFQCHFPDYESWKLCVPAMLQTICLAPSFRSDE